MRPTEVAARSRENWQRLTGAQKKAIDRRSAKPVNFISILAGANRPRTVRATPAVTARGAAGDKPAGSLPTGRFIAKVREPQAESPRLLREPAMFRPSGGDDTKLRRDETVSRAGEDIRKPALDTS